MKKRYIFVALAILAVGFGLTGCDLFKPAGESESTETVEPRTIKGTDLKGLPVVIEFTRPSKKAIDPANGDKYKITHDGVKASEGDILVRGTTITFYPKDGGDNAKFTGTYKGGEDLTFPNGIIPLADGDISFKPGSNNNSDAQRVAYELGDNATVDGNNVVIDFKIWVNKNIDVPAGVKLVFNTRGDEFIISKGVSVSAGGGIEVRNARSVKINGGGKLVVDGSSTLRGTMTVQENGILEHSGGTLTIEGGRLEIEDSGTLDMSGSIIIEKGGVLSVSGSRTEALSKVRYDDPTANLTGDKDELKDATFKGNGSLTVRNGGRFLMPDPACFPLANLRGEMEVEAGGEMIIYTGTPPPYNIDKRLHPLIGTLATAVDVSVGADFVMDPAANPGSKINVKVVSGKPVLELKGRATALGPINPNDDEEPDHVFSSGARSYVFVTYKFSVAADSILVVGNSTNRYSSLLIWEGGSLTSIGNARILVFAKNGIFWKDIYAKSQDAKKLKVYEQQGGDGGNPKSIDSSIDVAAGDLTGTAWYKSEEEWQLPYSLQPTDS